MNVTRFLIHVTSEEPLGDVARYDLRFVLKRVLKAQLEAGEINAPRFERERPAVTQLYVAEVNPTTPRDATQAANEGFLREENPYPPGSPAHARWDRAWVQAEPWVLGDE
jgi:hypothetical protein